MTMRYTNRKPLPFTFYLILTFPEIWHLCQMSLLTFERPRSELKVRTTLLKNLPAAIARLWFKLSSPKLAIREK